MRTFCRLIESIFKKKNSCGEIKKSFETKQTTLNPSPLSKEDPAYKTVEDIACRLQRQDARNIAVTGPYGSGKSSILLSLKENYPQYNYLNISLATLKSYEQETNNEGSSIDGEDEGNNLNRLIEYSILQQLIYRERQDVIPNSRFKRISHIENKKIYAIAAGVITFIISLIVVFEPKFVRIEWLCDILSIAWLNICADIVSIIYMLVALFYTTIFFIRYFGNSKLNKLNLKDAEIELTEDTSIFNKHLDEILYFFQVTDYNVILIEDLDRFESPDIFLKLRELNILLNESKIVDRPGQCIVFIYAVKDDIFVDAERSKFFDYITTVIPVINPSNSKDKLKEELEQRGYDDINDFHLKEISFFIDDMRLLKNIANEYHQYREKIGGELPSQNLLAMIVYKNYYPRSFSELHRCEGKIYECFRLKEIFIKKIIEELNSKIDVAKKKNDRILENQHLKEQELRQIYIDEYRRRLPECLTIKVNDSDYQFDDIISNKSLFDDLISQESITYTINYYGSISKRTQDIKFSDIEKKVDPSHNYKQRLTFLQTNFNQIKVKIETLERQRLDVQSLRFQELMQKLDLEQSEEYMSLELEAMPEFFLLRGYIDENYYDYISYFYGRMISRHDWDFVLGMKLNKKPSYDFHFDNIDFVIHEIPLYVYKFKSILNVEILSYLASNYEKNKFRIRYLIKIAVEENAWDFLVKCYQSINYANNIFSLIFQLKKYSWESFIKYDDELKDILIEIWIRYAEPANQVIESIEWVELHYSFLTERIEILGLSHIKEIIHSGNHKFTELNIQSNYLIEYIIANNFYKLNIHNINLIANYLLNENNSDNNKLNLTYIYNTDNKIFIEYVEENLELCLKDIFVFPSSKNESEETIVRIIEANNVSEKVKNDYLKNQKNTLGLEAIADDEDKILAMKLFLITPNWQQVYNYHQLVGEMTDELISFIEKFVYELIKSPSLPEDAEQKLVVYIVTANALSIGVYEKLLSALKKWKFDNINLSKLSSEKIEKLITYSMLKYSDYNTTMLSENFPSKIFAKYLIHHKSMYLKEINSINYTQELSIILMNSDELTNREKGLIIPSFSPDIFDGAIKLANDSLIVLQKEPIPVKHELLISILENSDMLNSKISVISMTINNVDLEEKEIDELLSTLPEPYRSVSLRGKKPLLPYSPSNEYLAEILKRKDYISSYSKKNNNIRIYTKKSR